MIAVPASPGEFSVATSHVGNADSTSVVTVAILFAGLTSFEPLLTATELTIVVPASVALSTFTTTRNVALVSAASVSIVAVIVPVLPTAGVVNVNAGPLVCSADTNVVLAGSTSIHSTRSASLGPAFDTKNVYVKLLPATTGSGESL